MEAIQTRGAVTAGVISQMKAIKMCALAGPVEAYIQNLWVKELRLGESWRMISVVAASVAQVLIAGYVLGFFHGGSRCCLRSFYSPE